MKAIVIPITRAPRYRERTDPDPSGAMTARDWFIHFANRAADHFEAGDYEGACRIANIIVADAGYGRRKAPALRAKPRARR